MNKTSFLYKVAILLAIGAGFISVLQTAELRSQLKAEREYIKHFENQTGVFQKESLSKAFEAGYKKCILDIYKGTPEYALTKNGDTDSLTIWKRDSVVNVGTPNKTNATQPTPVK
jgi:hypothetical protein